ncbi:MAG: FAD synthetase family protein [Spirochaetaceae bacterium]|nr:FAD synthetase family protein [Spirochaetaceae bacterium]
MRVSSWDELLASSPPEQGAAMTIGGFDGIHRGHALLLERVLEYRDIFEPTVVTFLRSPKALLRPADYPGDICTLSRKLEIFEERGIAHTVLIDFSRNFSKLGGRDFIELLAGRGGLRRLVVGSNFRCGYRMDTGTERIRELLVPRGIPVDVIESLMHGAAPVSSSRIRTAIGGGDMALASELLGRSFELELEGADGEGPVKSYGLSGRGILTPPPGVYEALIQSTGIPDTSGKIRTRLRVESGRVLVPSPFDAVRIEFLG